MSNLPSAVTQLRVNILRYIYQNQWTEIVTSGHNHSVFSEPVKPGSLLYVHNCFFNVPEVQQNDVMSIYIESGGQRLILRSQLRSIGMLGISVTLPFYVGEHRRVVGYAPDADLNDTLTLSIFGEMLSLIKWKKGKI